jgi:phage replication O-like protein O
MQNALYANTGDISSINSINPTPSSEAADNKMNLLPEHIGMIDKKLIEQLLRIKISGREHRILFAIHAQTIGFDKFENDLNGRRLEQLTGIRSDHVNDIICLLEEKNVIRTRRGYYGKWLAINFDFAHWGEIYAEVFPANIDPKCLLPLKYQVVSLDTGQDLSSSRPHVVELSTPLLGVDEVQPEKSVTSCNSNEIIKNKKAAKPIDHSFAPNLGDIGNKNNHKKTTDKTEKIKNSSGVDFDYPSFLPKETRQGILPWLQKIKNHEKAQGLLNYFASCLKNNPINHPVAYFITLVKRLIKGKLHLSPADLFSPKQKEEEKEARIKEAEQQLEKQWAILDYEQKKQKIEQEAKEKGCSFEECIKLVPFDLLWSGVVDTLEGFGVKPSRKMG